VNPFKILDEYLHAFVKGRLWLKVFIALILGIGGGVLLSPQLDLVPATWSSTIGSWLALPGMLFLKLVQMIMIPLIFTSIISGIVSSDNAQLRKLGMGVGFYFLTTTVISIAVGIGLATLIKPGSFFGSVDATGGQPEAVAESSELLYQIPQTISNLLPDNPLASMVNGEMLSIVIFTIIIGIALLQLQKKVAEPVQNLLYAIQKICMIIVGWAMRIVPLAVFGLMVQLVSSLGLDGLKGIGIYTATILLGLLILIIIYLLAVGLLATRNPFHFLRKIRDVQLLAFSTTSSAAVMPLSIKTAQEKLDVSPAISNFIVPIGATVNMDGTALYQCITTIFLAQVYGVELGFLGLLLVMTTIIAASIGTPAIPGGGVVILASVLQGIGIPAEGIILIIGIERILGMFRTAVNVTGDLTACVIFERWQGQPKASALETESSGSS
jgi:Na+/H+-dicarboxylate symporter